jgi:hypothetical protein
LQQLGESFSQRRRCVIRITVATTVAHLLLEGPALLTFAAAALKGSKTERHDVAMCLLNTGNNFLSIVNATIPFFLYLACNDQFRRMTFVYLRMRLCGIENGAEETLGTERFQSTIKRRWLPRIPRIPRTLSFRSTVTAHVDNSRRSLCSSIAERETVIVRSDPLLRVRPLPAKVNNTSSELEEKRRSAYSVELEEKRRSVSNLANDQESIITPAPDAISSTDGDEYDQLIPLKLANNHHVRFDNLPNHSDRQISPLDLPSNACDGRLNDKKRHFDDLVVKVSTI